MISEFVSLNYQEKCPGNNTIEDTTAFLLLSAKWWKALSASHTLNVVIFCCVRDMDYEINQPHMWLVRCLYCTIGPMPITGICIEKEHIFERRCLLIGVGVEEVGSRSEDRWKVCCTQTTEKGVEAGATSVWCPSVGRQEAILNEREAIPGHGCHITHGYITKQTLSSDPSDT